MKKKNKNYDIHFHTWKLMKLETIFDDVWVRAREREHVAISITTHILMC